MCVCVSFSWFWLKISKAISKDSCLHKNVICQECQKKKDPRAILKTLWSATFEREKHQTKGHTTKDQNFNTRIWMYNNVI